MPKASPAFVAFNGGELSPLLAGRVDQSRYGSGLRVCQNWTPTVQGPLVRRPGTRFVREVKNSAQPVWLLPFQFSVDQAYVLEFGHHYIRIHLNHGTLETSPGAPLEVATPWPVEVLTDLDGACRLRTAQSGDVLYIAHPATPPQKLLRQGALSWSLQELVLNDGPWDDQNPDEALRMWASASEGTVTINANFDAFAASDVGSLIWLEQFDSREFAWSAGAGIGPSGGQSGVGEVWRYQGNYYRAVQISGTTNKLGTVPPTHLEGIRRDGADNDASNWVDWLYLHSGWGYARITNYVSPTQVTAEVIKFLPGGVVGEDKATYRWRFGAFSNTRGWPDNVTFFRERLTFSKGYRLHFSVAGDFENFSVKTGPEQLADNALSIQIASGQVDAIQWLQPADGLLIGTAGGEFVCREMATSQVFGPGNVAILQQTGYGSRAVALQAGEAVLFVQRSGRALREMVYRADLERYASPDVTLLWEHITKGGLRQLAWQAQPDSVVWAVRADGALLGFTYNRAQEVTAWHRHLLGGGGAVESVCAIPRPDRDGDELWLVVRRTVNGQQRRYIEYLERGYDRGDDPRDAFYVDCGLTYDGPETRTISGLSHLEGQEVAILGDGAVQPTRVVTGGAISLHLAASRVQVGLPYVSVAQTMPIEAGSADGTAQGKTKKVIRAVLRLLSTMGLRAGPTPENTDLVTFRSAADPMGAPVPLVTGDLRFDWPAGFETDGCLSFVVSDPLPATVVAAFPQVDTRDR